MDPTMYAAILQMMQQRQQPTFGPQQQYQGYAQTLPYVQQPNVNPGAYYQTLPYQQPPPNQPQPNYYQPLAGAQPSQGDQSNLRDNTGASQQSMIGRGDQQQAADQQTAGADQGNQQQRNRRGGINRNMAQMGLQMLQPRQPGLYIGSKYYGSDY